MTQLPPVLRINRQADLDPEPPAEQPATTPESRPLVRLPGGQMSLKDQSTAAFAHALRLAWARLRDLAHRPGGPINALREAKPPSFDEECEYATSRAWVPPGHDGGVFEKLGVLHHALIGRPGVALGNSISGLCHKPLRFWLFVFTVALVVLLAWKA